jgi:hypothetical protein
MKVYKKLQVPNDSAWDRKTWRKHIHWRIKYFIDGVTNIFKWMPTIYKDRNFDDFFILKILQKKIEFQRSYLINSNRHTNIPHDNYWMTVVLNLLEREIQNYYSLEMYDYLDQHIDFELVEGSHDSYKMNRILIKENLDDYLNKYPSSIRKVMKKYKDIDLSHKETLALYVSKHNQEKCRNLLFEILKQKSECWWD